MQQQQLDLQKKQQEKLDAQQRDQQAQVLARARAGAGGGMRQLMSQATLGANGTNGSTTLGQSS
jgi:NAD-dependent DNA ligase